MGRYIVLCLSVIEISKDHLPRVTSQYEKLKAEINSLEYEKSNSANECQRLFDGITGMNKRVDQLQLTMVPTHRQLNICTSVLFVPVLLFLIATRSGLPSPSQSVMAKSNV
jgi:hypothetical protein